MKILIVTYLLLSSYVHAQDAVSCATKASQLALAIKAKAVISNQLQATAEKVYNGTIPENYKGPYQDPKITADQVCANLDSSQWEESRKQKKISLKLLTDEIKTKGKVSGTLAAGIDENAEKDMTPREFCASLAKTTQNTDYLSSFEGTKCDAVGQQLHKEMTSGNYLDKNFKEVCLDLYPKLKKHHNERVDCENGLPQSEIKSEIQNTPKPQTKNLPGVEQRPFRYLKPNGASAQ